MPGLLGQAFYKAGTSALNPRSSKGSSSAESIRPKSHSQTATINPREEVAVETEVEVQVEEVEEEEAGMLGADNKQLQETQPKTRREGLR